MAAHVLDRARRQRPGRIGLSIAGVARRLDVLLIGATLALTGIGLVMVYAASRAYALQEGLPGGYYLERQVLYAALGVVVMVLCTIVDYRRAEEWGYWIYGLTVFALIVVLSPIGTTNQAYAQRWISLGPIELQPSEFAVLGVIIAIACYVSRRERALGPRELVALLGLAALPMLLVVKQPDLGTAIVMGVVLATMLVIGGVKVRYLVALVVFVVLAFLAADALHLLNGYQISRLSCFLHQDSTSKTYAPCLYELNQAKTAIGSGGLTGLGFMNGPVTNLGYVPVAYADFVFSALGEQFGFLGCAVVLGLFGIVVFRIVRAAQVARDLVGRLLCVGVLAFIAFSVFQNVGMNIGIMPITGIPFPFFSYGGTAMIAFYAGIGLVHNVELRRGSLR